VSINEAQKRLVHKRRRLQRSRGLLRHSDSRLLPQLVVHQRKKLFGGPWISL
jgi:hypothetical protein